ncbi:sulfite exporter TauE/SafE family protein [Mariniphaga sediminis]|uniref:sulfite exporter TauE/SafE family protein n=1 Tax=Mariniphaga sediminis TaxID=1628158 RepID=UPI001F4E8D2A|nr:sulfite exporter TauE/SafE family protein [Mariniphaga sediminis]
MLEITVICFTAFFTAILTFFSGFGLGTILMPVFALFFPVEIAIALTGVVHFANNIFKMGLVGKMASRPVLIRFGIPAVMASFIGAWLLLKITGLPSVYEYELWGRMFQITPVKLIIAVLLLFFSVSEILPAMQKIQMGGNRLIFGGLLSGFFGGLAGVQGALRSAFLIKSGLSKEAFIATGVIIASLVDITRLSVYASRFTTSGLSENLTLLVSATLAAIAGAFAGSRLLKKVTFRFVQVLVAVMLTFISIGLGAGLI